MARREGFRGGARRFLVRYLWGGLTTLAVVIIALVISLNVRGNRVRLDGSNDLRILKVSLGTNHFFSAEPVWKQTLRSVLPKRGERLLGKPQEWRTVTLHSSLVLWVEEVDASGMWHAPCFTRPRALLDGAIAVAGRSWELPTRTVRLEFNSFARDQKHVPLQVDYRSNTISFSIRNPAPAVRQQWRPGPLPQTNRVLETDVVLAGLWRYGRTGDSDYQGAIRARAVPSPGWISWRVTVLDDMGNWAATAHRNFSPIGIPGLARTNSAWRVSVEGMEYISAGYPIAPAAGSGIVIIPPARAELYGLRAMAFIGAGRHGITNGALSGGPDTLPGTNALSLEHFEWTGRSKWSAEVRVRDLALLTVSELRTIPPNVRARERLPGNGGRIFPLRMGVSVTNGHGAQAHVATLCVLPIPFNATNLELEVIGSLPETSFFVAPGDYRQTR